MKMFKSRGGSTEGSMSSSTKSADGYYGGTHKSTGSHSPVKGTPMPGHASSTMEKAQMREEKSEPGEKKYKSNTMSPGCKAGQVNDYGK